MQTIYFIFYTVVDEYDFNHYGYALSEDEKDQQMKNCSEANPDAQVVFFTSIEWPIQTATD